jgi:endonuclease/exonuclease/phosphatase (EEP) superfamily protein YafD
MEISEIIMLILCGIFLIPTIASLTRFDIWWVRGFDFPRIQISFLMIIVLILSFIFFDFSNSLHFIAIGLLLLSLFYQCYKIFPYTYLAKKKVLQYEDGDSDDNISILVSNVLTPNKNYHKLIEIVNRRQPDILLTLETDKTWEQELEVIEKDYPYTVKVPQDNLYGMHLYSKLKLEEIEVRYLVKDDIPSIHGFVRLDDNSKIRIHCLHPKPPSPSEARTSTKRDAELLMVGRDIREQDDSVLVFGDLNDVAWSRTTRLFQKTSTLLDPRIGRGFFNTFHADYKLLRWPLDHVFHSNDFTLVDIAREKHVGSDHFPMYINLNFERKAEDIQEKPAPDEEEKEWAQEKIDEAEPREEGV